MKTEKNGEFREIFPKHFSRNLFGTFSRKLSRKFFKTFARGGAVAPSAGMVYRAGGMPAVTILALGSRDRL